MMKKLLITALMMISFIIPSYAQKTQNISVEELNKLIEQTNFIVNAGCSGTLIDFKNKLILTNYHCVDNKITIIDDEQTTKDGFVRKVKRKRYVDVQVEQNGYDGFTRVSNTSYIAEIVAENKKVDLAVLRIKGDIPHTLQSTIIPDGLKVVRGERIYTVGNPIGQDATLVEGIVSSVNRTFEFPWTDGEKLPMIQISGGLTGGNSGGALYNAQGYFIGVPAAGAASATFIGLAIPHHIVKTFLRNNCLAESFDSSFSNQSCLEKTKEKKDKEKD